MPLDNALARSPPHNHEAEMLLLGAVMSRNELYWPVASLVRADMFADPRHGRIWDAIAEAVRNGIEANPVTLREALGETLAEIGGAEYLSRLYAGAVYVGGAESYALTVRDRWLRRRTIELCDAAREKAHEITLDGTADGVIAEAHAALTSLAGGATSGAGIIGLDAALDDVVETADAAHRAGGAITGMTLGIDDLDDRIDGLHAEELVILAGRPGMGKSTFGLNAARHMAKCGRRVAWFTLEMSPKQNAAVLLASEAGISARNILRGRFDTYEAPKIVEARHRLSGLPLTMVKASGWTAEEVEAEAARLRAHVAFIDHLGHLAGASRSEPWRSRYEKVAGVSNALKAMAMRLGIPVVALCQLSREVEKRDDKRPTKADLRDAGDLEQDADVILFLYRDSYYAQYVPKDKQTDDWKAMQAEAANKAEVIVAKQRMGEEGMVEVFYDPARSLFGNLAGQSSIAGIV